MKTIELRPVKEFPQDFDYMEARIKRAFKLYFYNPLLRELLLPQKTIQNSANDLIKAVETGRITVSRGTFSGKFDAGTSKALTEMGAVWDRKSSTFKLPVKNIPVEIRAAVKIADLRFKERMARIDKILSEINPENISGKISTKDLFASTISRTDREIKSSAKSLMVYPELSKEQTEKIAEEWQNNMNLWINNFTEEEIKRLRGEVGKSVFAGNRYESLIGTIQKSYGVTERKAKFLARQETALLMAKFKETRYTDAGVKQYKWKCVAGTKNHPVRPSHKILDGTIQRWDTPPITTAPDEPQRRNNPGCDYNCRCLALPIVKL